MYSYALNQAYSGDLVAHCTHALTLQTNLYTCNSSEKGLDSKSERAIQAYRKFIPHLNRILTGNGWTRNPNYLPLIIPSLEGKTDTYSKNKTLHFHLALGNIDSSRIDADSLEKMIDNWISTGVGTSDIKLRKLSEGHESGWGEYVSKEVWKGNFDAVDFSTIQVPAHLTGN